ncbi:MAG: M4 family metallopeptidase [Gammaproteobacteria bacterium]|nr:M4 family metallopeptidase [Gammaproteobacteria bacterium]
MDVDCHCCFIPSDVLERLSKDKNLSRAQRKAFVDALDSAVAMRARRVKTRVPARPAVTRGVGAVRPPQITVYDCARTMMLPGSPMADVAASSDPTVQQTASVTAALVKFYKEVFGRNSVDNRGMVLQSSIHYGVSYNNAFWNGTQMTYGDGDGNFFVDFTRGADVIAHELTHGVVQHSARLAYQGEAGGLNESLADVFGSMFRLLI